MSEQEKTREEPRQSPLHTERGSTTISDSVVSQVAGMAASEVEGVRMGGGTARAVGGVLEGVTGSSSGRTRGVSVEVGREEAAVDLDMSVEYGRPIPKVSEAVRRNVVNRIENLLGLGVTEVNITVNDVLFPDGEEDRSG